MPKQPDIRWRNKVKRKDLDAAHDYLTLRLGIGGAASLMAHAKGAPIRTRRANDLLRACLRNPAAPDDPGVQRKLKRVVDGKKLKPVIFVVTRDGTTDIAQGYHETSAAYALDPFATVPVLLVDETSKGD